jgi:hypothetical protein
MLQNHVAIVMLQLLDCKTQRRAEMQNVQNVYGLPNMVSSAASDCGRVTYSPIGNDRLIIDGRDVYQGQYVGDDGFVTGERPEASIWTVAKQLMRAIDTLNIAAQDKARDESLQRAIDKDNRAAEFEAWAAKSDEVWL